MDGNVIIIIFMVIIENQIMFLEVVREMSNKGELTDLDILKEHLRDNVIPSFYNIRVISYVFVSVVFVGGAGIWMPWAKEESISAFLPGSTVFTYVFALLGTLICDRLYFYTKALNEVRTLFEKEDVTQEHIKVKYLEFKKGAVLFAFGTLLGSLIILLVTFAYAKYYNSDSFIGWLGLALAILMYFFVSAKEVDESSNLPGKDDEAIVPVIDDSSVDEERNSSFFGNG